MNLPKFRKLRAYFVLSLLCIVFVALLIPKKNRFVADKTAQEPQLSNDVLNIKTLRGSEQPYVNEEIHRSAALAKLETCVAAVIGSQLKEVDTYDCLQSLTRPDLLALLFAYASDEMPPVNHPLRELLFRRMGAELGGVGIDIMLEATAKKQLAERDLKNYCAGFVSTDWDACHEMLTTGKDPILQNALAEGIVGHSLSLSFADSLRNVISVQSFVKSAHLLGESIASNWLLSQNDETQKANFIDIMSSALHDEFKRTIANNYVGHLSKIDLDSAMDKVASIPKEHLWGGELLLLTSSASPAEFAKLPNFLVNCLLAKTPGSEAALQNLGLRASRADANAVAEMLVSIQGTEGYDYMASGFVRAIWNEDPESAQAWHDTIKSERLRELALKYPVSKRP